MTAARALLAILLLASAAGAPAAAETVSITLPPDAVTLPPGPGADVTQTQCAFCHSLDYITTQPRGPATQWQGVVTKMQKVYGAPISEDNAKLIAEYLAAHYAR
jgi:sulfite dehydrogenase (cytochrome) subunit B